MLPVLEFTRILLTLITKRLKVRLNSCTPEIVFQPPDPKLATEKTATVVPKGSPWKAATENYLEDQPTTLNILLNMVSKYGRALQRNN